MTTKHSYEEKFITYIQTTFYQRQTHSLNKKDNSIITTYQKEFKKRCLKPSLIVGRRKVAYLVIFIGDFSKN